MDIGSIRLVCFNSCAFLFERSPQLPESLQELNWFCRAGQQLQDVQPAQPFPHYSRRTSPERKNPTAVA
jgi:hypothetical protein